jgi:hypothetical protein
MKFQKLKEKLGIKQPEAKEPEMESVPKQKVSTIPKIKKEKAKFDKGFRNHIGDLYHTKRL